MHFLNFKRILEQSKIRYVAKSAILLFFCLLCCFGFHKRIAKTLCRSKLPQKQMKLRKPEQFVVSNIKIDQQ